MKSKTDKNDYNQYWTNVASYTSLIVAFGLGLYIVKRKYAHEQDDTVASVVKAISSTRERRYERNHNSHGLDSPRQNTDPMTYLTFYNQMRRETNPLIHPLSTLPPDIIQLIQSMSDQSSSAIENAVRKKYKDTKNSFTDI